MMLEAVTKAKQKTIVTAIFTIYTNAWYSFSFIVLLFSAGFWSRPDLTAVPDKMSYEFSYLLSYYLIILLL